MSKKVIKSDLKSNSLNAIINKLQNDAQDAKCLRAVVSDLINDTSDELEGASYDAVRNKLSEYANILSEREEIANSLANAIKKSSNQMIDFMEQFDTIDTNERETTKNKISTLEGTIDSITNDYNNSKYEENTSLSSLTYSYYQDLEKAKKYLEKINNLSSEDSSCYSPIGDINSEINNYKSSISNISESKIS